MLGSKGPGRWKVLQVPDDGEALRAGREREQLCILFRLDQFVDDVDQEERSSEAQDERRVLHRRGIQETAMATEGWGRQ